MGMLGNISDKVAKLRLVPYSHKNLPDRPEFEDAADFPYVVVELQPGEVCVFRGDLIHAGTTYDSHHFRLHGYFNIPSWEADRGMHVPNEIALLPEYVSFQRV